MSTAALNQPAARPLLGGFVTTKFSKEYPDFLFSNIDDFLKQ
jgi:dTDP-4-dehydrorhamnose reductase